MDKPKTQPPAWHTFFAQPVTFRICACFCFKARASTVDYHQQDTNLCLSFTFKH